jgi:hypothetical protein
LTTFLEIQQYGEWLKEWAQLFFATENTEFFEKNSDISVGSMAKPTKLSTPVICTVECPISKSGMIDVLGNQFSTQQRIV